MSSAEPTLSLPDSSVPPVAESAQAPELHSAAAAAGDAEAQYRLGLCHVHGWGTPVNADRAVEWLRRAAEQGHAGAADSLGVRYATGQGVPQDDRTAVLWFRRAARAGHRVALYNLGLACYFGTGTAVDPVEACACFWRAAALGDELAIESRDRVWAELSAEQQAAVRQTLAQAAILRHELGVIFIGSSTGGTEALRAILPQLPATMPPICVVQHIQSNYSEKLAASLNRDCAFPVHHAGHGEILRPGSVYIAPAGRHMRLIATNETLRLRLCDDVPVHHQRPAVDVLFRSAAKISWTRALGIVLTGMGRDGAAGLFALRRAGARTVVQDESTSVVYGMPKAAWKCGAAESQVALGRMPALMLAWAHQQRQPRSQLPPATD